MTPVLLDTYLLLWAAAGHDRLPGNSSAAGHAILVAAGGQVVHAQTRAASLPRPAAGSVG